MSDRHGGPAELSERPGDSRGGNRSAIRFVYFDLGNVLVSFDPQIACRNLTRLFGGTPERAKRVVYGSGLQHRFERGEISGRQYADLVRAGFGSGKEVPAEEILEAISAMFQPVEEMAAIVAGVRASGLRTGILSNTCVAHWQWIGRQRYDCVSTPFDATILSYEVRSMKPDELIYREAELAAGVSPEEILFLDDRAENVAAARRRGWQAAHCFGGPPARAALEDYGVWPFAPRT